MSLTFPASPTVGDTYTVGARTWTWSGTIWEITGTVAAAGSIGTAELADSAVTTAKIAASARPKTYVTKYTTYTDTSWTCPAGVTQIKLTLIGAGGASGDAAATTAFSSSTIGSPANTAGSTTFTVGGTVYTALGGKKGADVSVTGNPFEMYGTYGGISSGSSSSAGTGNDFSRYPGCGGAPTSASASTQRTFSDGVEGFASHTSRAYALAYRGQDGVTEVFQVTVVPGTAYSFSIGLGAGFAGYLTTDSNMGSNGAVIIEYVV
jgi:hypothetical protein